MDVAWLAEITASVAELLKGSVAKVVGVVRTAVACVWFAAATPVELAKLTKLAELAELATALMT